VKGEGFIVVIVEDENAQSLEEIFDMVG